MTHDRPSLARPLLLMALAAWVVAFALLAHQAGPWTDDYGFNLRGYQTDSIWPVSSPWSVWPYYWRPVFLAVAYYGATLAWDQWWALALLTAVCHGLVAYRVWRLCRVIGLGELSSAGAAMVTLLYPLAFESAFWWAGIGTPGAVAVGVYVVERAWRFAAPQRVRLVELVWIFGWATLLVNINEQPVSLFAGACAAALVSGWRSRGSRHALGRSAWVAVSCGLACVVYVALLVSTSPPGKRGASGGYVTLAQLPGRINTIAHQAQEKLLGTTAQEFLAGSFIHGVRTIADQGVLLGGVCAMALLAPAAWLVRRAARQAAEPMPQPDPHAADLSERRTTLIAAAAIGGFVLLCAFVPNILVVTNTLCSRYFLVIGVVLGLWFAMVVQALTGGTARRAGRAAGAAMLVSVLTVVGTISMLGFQRVFRDRFAQESTQARVLRNAVPNPPPGTFYICLQDDSRTASTGYDAFDRTPSHSIRFPWSARSYIRRGMDRADAEALPMLRPGVRASLARWPIDGVTAENERVATGSIERDDSTARDGLVVTRPAGRPSRVIPLDRCVPYVLRADGSLALVSRLVSPVVGQSSDRRPVAFPLVNTLGDDRCPRIEFSMIEPQAPADSAPSTLTP